MPLATYHFVTSRIIYCHHLSSYTYIRWHIIGVARFHAMGLYRPGFYFVQIAQNEKPGLWDNLSVVSRVWKTYHHNEDV